MSSATGGLKELHQVHLALQERQEKLKAGPRRIAAHEKVIAKRQAEIEAQKQNITELQKAADQKNLQYRTNEQQISEFRTRLNQAASNKEFEIVKGQIAAETEANEKLEDEYLELTEEVDAARSRLEELTESLKETEAALQKVKDDFAAEEAGLHEQVAEIQAELKEAEKCIPAKMMEMYRRLVGAHGAGSLAPIDGNACSECFVELSPQNLVEVRNAQIVTCKSCGRFLYLPDEE